MTQTAVATRATGGFADLDEEVSLDSIEVTGELPGWLEGSLVRVTPAKFDLEAEHLEHWFDGLAMLNRFGFANGRVSYASRFLESEAYSKARRGERPGVGFATDPCRSIFKRVQSMFSPDVSDNANVNLMRLGERYIAMTETPLPVEFDRKTLAALGRPYVAPGQLTTAHPHHDRARGEAVNYAVHFGPRTTYRLYATGADGRPRVIGEVPVRQPAYMHSFGMTERFAVFAETPLVVNPMRLAVGAESFIGSYRWKPERGTRFIVVDRHGGGIHTTATAEPFFCFHHVNAWEEGDDVVVDLVAFDDASVIDQLFIDRLRTAYEPQHSQLRRYRIGRDGTASGEVLLNRSVELPRIDYARASTRPHRTVYAAGIRPDAPDWFNEVVKFDTVDRTLLTWHEDGCYPGEPVFVGRPGRDRDDDGAVLSVVYDSRTERSFLLVLEASTFTEVARAEAPQRIPFGFHGQFFT